MYKSQLFFKDVLWVVAVHTIKTSWKQKKQYLTTLLERIHGENPKKQKNIDKIKKTSRKPKKQKTKTFQRMFGLRLMFGFFWFCLVFFCFFLALTLKKLKELQVFLFLDKMMVKEV